LKKKAASSDAAFFSSVIYLPVFPNYTKLARTGTIAPLYQSFVARVLRTHANKHEIPLGGKLESMQYLAAMIAPEAASRADPW